MASSNKKYKKSRKTSNKGKQKKGSILNYKLNIFCIIILIVIIVLIICDNLLVNKKLSQINNNVTNLYEQITLEEIAPHYVFLGDSITNQFELSKYFNGYSVVNSGRDGNQTQHILDDMEERVYQYNPSTVFLMIGTNDVNSNQSVEHIFKNIKKIVEEIQINLPNTKIVVQSIYPSQEKWCEFDDNEKRKKVNQLLYEEYDDSDVIYLDIYSMLEDKNTGKLKDEYTEDGLHMNDKSYKIIAKELKKYMTMKNRNNK